MSDESADKAAAAAPSPVPEPVPSEKAAGPVAGTEPRKDEGPRAAAEGHVGGNLTKAEIGAISSKGPVSINFTTGAPPAPKAVRSRPPARSATLPAPFPRSLLEVERAVNLLERERFLVIECPHQELQWRTAAAVLRDLDEGEAAATDRIDDAGYGATSPTGREADPNPRWDLEDLEHPELQGEAKLLVLELSGAAGRSRFDSLLGSPGSRRALTGTLQRTSRYLLLLTGSRHLPRGARTGDELPVLVVPFLRLWLHERFPEHHEILAELVRGKLAQRDWESEEAVFTWLCTHAAELSAPALIELLSGQLGEPKPLAAVREALERCEERDEVFLTAIFVATYLPGLSPYEFSEVMQALLDERSRPIDRPAASGAPAGAGEARPELLLTTEWQQTSRQIMARGDLTSRPNPNGAGAQLAFRAQLALPALQKELDATPFFVDSHLERLQQSGLLFHSHEAIRRAVIQLLVRVSRHAPLRLGADWLLGLLETKRLNLGLRPLAQADAEEPQEEMPRTFLYAEDLLRQLADAAPHEGAPRSSAVIGVIDALLQRAPTKAKIGLELAYRLRNASNVNPWPWLRRALEDTTSARQGVRALAVEQLERLVSDPARGADALRTIIAWLPEKGDLEGCQEAARDALEGALARSFQPAGAAEAKAALPFSSLLEQLGDEPTAAELTGLLTRIAAHVPVEEFALPMFSADGLDELPDGSIDRWTATWRATQARLNESLPDLLLHKRARRLASCLAAWQLVKPFPSARLYRIAERAREVLESERRTAPQFVGLLIELLADSELQVASDAQLTSAQRRRWIEELRQRKQRLIELRGWLAGKPGPADVVHSSVSPRPQPTPELR